MTELLVILGALVTLVLSIAGMKFYLWWTDVLTGPYISNRDSELTVPDQETDRTSRVIAEREAHDTPLPAKPDFGSDNVGFESLGNRAGLDALANHH